MAGRWVGKLPAGGEAPFSLPRPSRWLSPRDRARLGALPRSRVPRAARLGEGKAEKLFVASQPHLQLRKAGAPLGGHARGRPADPLFGYEHGPPKTRETLDCLCRCVFAQPQQHGPDVCLDTGSLSGETTTVLPALQATPNFQPAAGKEGRSLSPRKLFGVVIGMELSSSCVQGQQRSLKQRFAFTLWRSNYLLPPHTHTHLGPP